MASSWVLGASTPAPALPARAPLGASAPHYGGGGLAGRVDAARDLTTGGWRLAARREPRPAAPPGGAARGAPHPARRLKHSSFLARLYHLAQTRLPPPSPSVPVSSSLPSSPAGGRPPGLVGSGVGGFPPGSLYPGDKPAERGASPRALAGTQLSLRSIRKSATSCPGSLTLSQDGHQSCVPAGTPFLASHHPAPTLHAPPTPTLYPLRAFH